MSSTQRVEKVKVRTVSEGMVELELGKGRIGFSDGRGQRVKGVASF